MKVLQEQLFIALALGCYTCVLNSTATWCGQASRWYRFGHTWCSVWRGVARPAKVRMVQPLLCHSGLLPTKWRLQELVGVDANVYRYLVRPGKPVVPTW